MKKWQQTLHMCTCYKRMWGKLEMQERVKPWVEEGGNDPDEHERNLGWVRESQCKYKRFFFPPQLFPFTCTLHLHPQPTAVHHYSITHTLPCPIQYPLHQHSLIFRCDIPIAFLKYIIKKYNSSAIAGGLQQLTTIIHPSLEMEYTTYWSYKKTHHICSPPVQPQSPIHVAYY